MVTDLNQLTTEPGASGPVAPPVGTDNPRAYRMWLKQQYEAGSQELVILTRWIGAPNHTTPDMTIEGPFADDLTQWCRIVCERRRRQLATDQKLDRAA